MAITSIVVIYEEIGGLHIDGFTQIYFGITFCGFVVLALFIPRQHDQLGLWTETVCIFVLGAVSMVFLFVAINLEDQTKRVWSLFGGALIILLINSISLYITMVLCGGYKACHFKLSFEHFHFVILFNLKMFENPPAKCNMASSLPT